MDQYINGEVLELEGDEAKDTHKRSMDKDKRCIANSIKDHLIPHVSSFKTPKEVFDDLTNMFKGKNINRKMTLRNRLKNLKILNLETIQSYFTRDAQIKEQLEVVEENVEEREIVMTTLNGLPRSWDSFIQGICARRKLISFDRLREECTQEESRLITREENMVEIEYQALAAHTRRNYRKKENHHHNKRKDNHHKRQNKFKRYPSNI